MKLKLKVTYKKSELLCPITQKNIYQEKLKKEEENHYCRVLRENTNEQIVEIKY